MRSHVSTLRCITVSPLGPESIILQCMSGKRLDHVSQRTLARLNWSLYVKKEQEKDGNVLMV